MTKQITEQDYEPRLFDHSVGDIVVTGKLNSVVNYFRVPVYLLGMAISDAVFPRSNSYDGERER